MRIFIRVVISVVAGFFLMWPLGYVYGLLRWPTFHSWGLAHGAFFSAWPTLSLLTYLLLGYVRYFARVHDTLLLILGLAWGLVLTGFLAIGHYLSAPAVDSLLAATTASVAVLGFFARYKLRVALVVVLPIIFFNMEFLLDGDLPRGAVHAFDEIKGPLIFALLGWGLGSLARIVLKRPPAII